MDPQGRLLVPVWSQIGFIKVPFSLPSVPIQVPSQVQIQVPIQVPIQVLIQIPVQFPVHALLLISILRFHLQQLFGCFAGIIVGCNT